LDFAGKYQGASFWELLRVDYEHLLPDLGDKLGAIRAETVDTVPHGTTVLAFRYVDGVLVAGDRLATEGYRVASRDIQKVYPTDAHSLIAIAGAAGPSIEMARIMRIELEHYEKIEGEPLELDGKANKLSQMVRANLPAAMQGLAVIPLFAGYDRRRKIGRLWKFDVTGGRYEETDFESTGSGSLYARESLKKSHRADLSRDEAARIALRALMDAADEDRGTGGVDVGRGIYPTFDLCSDSGIVRVPEREVHQIYEELTGETRGVARS
jgi:proteasome beta subunit